MSLPTSLRTRLTAAVVAVLLAVAVLSTSPAQAAPAPAGSTWRELYITTPDGESLHTDVLRPAGLTDADKTPVILVVSPYIGTTSGPSDRFFDFFNGAKVFERGYSVVMVSLRGTGGSSGCLDILGPGEQTDVATAVRWAATQPWSTGAVGMYGKSYDANTGVMGAALQPVGLKAVVAQAIAPDRYRGSYNDRVRLAQSLLYPGPTYGTQAEGQGYPGRQTDTTYTVNAMSRSGDCQALLAEHYADDENSAFWRSRDFVERAKGSTVPTFITAGYLDNATNIGAGAIDFFNALEGPKKLWVGWWAHDRGNDVVGDRLAIGRQGFFDEVMAFYDRHLKGLEVPNNTPDIAAQSSDGTWRSEASFPPADAETLTSTLQTGSYADDGRNRGSRVAGPGGSPVTTGSAYGSGVWTFSTPVTKAVQLNGIPTATIDVKPQAPRTNVVVNVYDVAEDGAATMLTRGAAMADVAGSKNVQLWPTDWTLEPGHRIGVLVSGSNNEAFTHVPTNTKVTVTGGRIRLPFLSRVRTSNIDGDASPRLESYKTAGPFTVAAATIEANTNPDFKVAGQ